MIVKPLDHVGHQSLSVSWNDKERFSLTRDPTNLASLLLQERFPRLANPGPALEVILARFFPDLLIPASRPIGRRGACVPEDARSSTHAIHDWYDWQSALEDAAVLIDQLIPEWCHPKWMAKKVR
jgi:hypothetical protein